MMIDRISIAEIYLLSVSGRFSRRMSTLED